MKSGQILLIAGATLFSYAAMAVPYLTEATITPIPDNGQYRVEVSISRLIQKDGKQVEELVAKPRILSSLGCPASLYQGLQPENPDYPNQDNVRVNVSWPYPKESGMAYCTVIVKHGSELESESQFQLKISGPGRAPLVLSPQTVNRQSVHIVTDKSRGQSYVLLEFADKTPTEAKAMAIENLGNKAQIRNASGDVVGSGIVMGGSDKNIGIALSYNSEEEAQRVASALEGTD